MSQEKILVTGANGQLGTVLTASLREKYGPENVIASDIKESSTSSNKFVMLDILNIQRLKEVIDDFGITQIYHLAAILSANGEWNPLKTWNVNLNAWINMLELIREKPVKKIFYPSTIGVFGDTTPKLNTPQHTAIDPLTMYGVSKRAGELINNYYHHKYHMDIRSIRYPGIIGYQSIPSGGTTDYAVEIFHQALKEKKYTCFLEADTTLPMIYIHDAIKATLILMETSAESISIRTSYNLAGMSFSPSEIAAEIKKYIPEFEISYEPDFRQQIAASWTQSIDDEMARKDWNWVPDYNLAKMTDDMFEKLSQ